MTLANKVCAQLEHWQPLLNADEVIVGFWITVVVRWLMRIPQGKSFSGFPRKIIAMTISLLAKCPQFSFLIPTYNSITVGSHRIRSTHP